MTAPATLWLRRLVSPRRPPAPDRGGVPAAGPRAATECERGRGLSALAGTPIADSARFGPYQRQRSDGPLMCDVLWRSLRASTPGEVADGGLLI
jgi:hypothetical protein